MLSLRLSSGFGIDDVAQGYGHGDTDVDGPGENEEGEKKATEDKASDHSVVLDEVVDSAEGRCDLFGKVKTKNEPDNKAPVKGMGKEEDDADDHQDVRKGVPSIGGRVIVEPFDLVALPNGIKLIGPGTFFRRLLTRIRVRHIVIPCMDFSFL
jgi:hypothetical protein